MADAMLTREAVERRRVALATGSADGALRPSSGPPPTSAERWAS